MTPGKRALDVVLALILSTALLPMACAIAMAILIRDGRPVFYVAERMQTPTRAFAFWKFRTMRVVASDAGVTGGDKSSRLTHMGSFLRRTRLDEIPQLWNVLKGDISFVGPRAPLRQYVERFPDLYARVLRSRPGITGLATLYYHRHEERLLARCDTAAETDAVYARACVPRKAQLDLIYQKRRTLILDLRLIVMTAARAAGRDLRGCFGTRIRR